MEELIRSILAEHARLSADPARIGESDDLYRLGLTSHSTVNVMLALEDAFDIEIPDTMLRKSTFQSIASIRAVVSELTSDAQSA
jgi:acyl carrier protein